MPLIASQRHLFDVPDEVAYFTCAYYGPLAERVARPVDRKRAGQEPSLKRKAPDSFADAETIRKLCTEVIGGEAEGYALVPAASYGIGTSPRAPSSRGCARTTRSS